MKNIIRSVASDTLFQGQELKDLYTLFKVNIKTDVDCILGVQCHFKKYLCYIVVFHFIAGGKWILCV